MVKIGQRVDTIHGPGVIANIDLPNSLENWRPGVKHDNPHIGVNDIGYNIDILYYFPFEYLPIKKGDDKK